MLAGEEDTINAKSWQRLEPSRRNPPTTPLCAAHSMNGPWAQKPPLEKPWAGAHNQLRSIRESAHQHAV